MTRRLSKEENFKVSLYSVALVSMQMGFIADKPTKIAKQGYFCVETDAKDKLERMGGESGGVWALHFPTYNASSIQLEYRLFLTLLCVYNKGHCFVRRH